MATITKRATGYQAQVRRKGFPAVSKILDTRREAEVWARCYSSIYVRVTAEDEKSQKQQIDRLRELIDAGVFVFAGGAPRSKAKDSDSIQQFILS